MANVRSLYVHVHLADGPVAVGRLDFDQDGRRSSSSFRYGERWLRHPERFPIDPVTLPLPAPGEGTLWRTAEGFELFGAIRDASPDAWGRHVMDRAAAPTVLGELDYLLNGSEERVGALDFSPQLDVAPGPVADWARRTLPGRNLDLEALAQAADRFDSADELDETLRRFILRGSSLGGARPKATATWKDGSWIAKFARADDRFDVCRAEFATMRMARICGLDVPEVELQSRFGRAIYLVRRFDRLDGPGGEACRIPFISGLTLLGGHESDRHHTYSDLAAALRRYGSEPARDALELYRRMVFNILCGNTDDHLRNHGFLWYEKGWRLSPAYDLVPHPQSTGGRRLALGVSRGDREATLENAKVSAPAFGILAGQAESVIAEMQSRARSWRQEFEAAGMDARDVERVASCWSEVGPSAG